MSKHFDKLPPWARSARMWGGLVIVLFGVYGGAATIGLDIPRPAWVGEVQAVEAKVVALEVEVAGALSKFQKTYDANYKQTTKHLFRLEARGVKSDLVRLRLRLSSVDERIEKATEVGQPVRSLRRDKIILETDIERLQRDLTRLEALAR